MSAPLGRRDFFALEAGEYLERLGLLAGSEGVPESESLVRYARALRGAALMAGPPGYAVAASAIENVAKALRDGTTSWSPALAEELGQAIETGKQLLRRIQEWSEQDIARCERTASRLNDLAGAVARRLPFAAANVAPTQSAAVRAYVARETAALAATLDQAADAVEQFIPDGLATVAQRLQPLRGLGALPGLTPLPELLEALDLTLALGAPGGAWPPGSARCFRATAAALARIARDIAELGATRPDSPEIAQAAELLRAAFAEEADVVAIEALIRARDGDGVVRRGTPPSPPAGGTDITVELVSLADRLRHGAAVLRSGPSGPARMLQLHSLVLSLRGVTLSPAVSGTAGRLVRLLDLAVMSGRGLRDAEPIGGVLERAARALTDAAETGSIAALGTVLAPLCAQLDAAGPAPAPAPIVPIESLAPEPDADVVPIESLAPEPAAVVVPIASLAPAPETSVVSIESLGYDAAPAYTAFEQSFSTYFRLLRRGRPAPAAATAAAAPEAVAIQTLLYRGRRALERANLVRRELDAALRTEQQLGDIRALLGELLDLVPLALDDER